MATDRKRISAKDIESRLAARFAPPAFAFLPQCRNGTGYTRSKTRTADAIALGLWPSRGLDLHGFEIKVSRYDWLNELKNPAKAEDIQQFCDRWWLVVSDSDIVQAGELPSTWGLMVANGNGLKVVTEAPKLESKPLDKPMICSIFRKASECVVPLAQIQDKIDAAVNRGMEAGKADADRDSKRNREIIAAFEKESCVSLGTYSFEAGDVGKAVKFVMDADLVSVERRARDLLDIADSIASQLRQALPPSAETA